MGGDTFETLLQVIEGLLQPNNHVIKAAEEKFEEFKKNPEWIVPNLCEAVKQLTEGKRIMAALLLRKSVDDVDVYDNLSDQSKAGLQAGLLEFMKTLPSTDRPTRRSINAAVAALGARLVRSHPTDGSWKRNDWPTLLPTLYEMVQSGNEDQMVSALYVFQCMSSMLDNQGPTVLPMLNACIGFDSLNVKVEAVQCAFAFAQHLEETKPFAALIPAIFGVLQACIPNHIERATEVLEGLIELQEANSFLQESGHMPTIVNSMLELASNQAIESEVRHIGVELLITFCECDSRAAKRMKDFLPRFIRLLLGWIQTEPEPDQEWHVTKKTEEDTTFEDNDVGAEGLDRLALAVGGASMEKYIGSEIFRLAESAEWRDRFAAIQALCYIAEGCRDKFEPILGQLTHLILRHLDHPHPKVRCAAGCAIAQFCTDFSDGFQRTFSREILQAVDKLLGDSVPRCRYEASTIIVNFCEDAIPETYKDQLEALLGAYYNILTSDAQPMFVRQISISAISAIAENQGKNFLPYYAKFMPIIQSIFAMPEVKEHNTVKGIAIECASFMCIAVGKEVCLQGNVAVQVMDYMLNVTANMTDDDTRGQYLFQSWARLSEVIGDDFAPYLDALMPKLMAQMTSKEDMSVVHVHDKIEESSGVQVMKFSGTQQKLVIRSSVLEEKQRACDIVHSFFQNVPQLMFKYIEHLPQAVVPLLNNAHVEGIRATASEIVYEMIKAVKGKVDEKAIGSEQVGELLKLVLDDYLDALYDESDTPTGAQFLENLSLILKLLGDECIPMVPCKVEQKDGSTREEPHGFLRKAMNHLRTLFSQCLQKIEALREGEEEVAGDEDEAQKLAEGLDDEENYLQHCGECVGHFLRTHKMFLEMFVTEFLPAISGELLPSTKYGTAGPSIALSILVDFLEFGKEAAMPFFHDITHAFIAQGLKSPDLAQSASYGLNVAAVYAMQISAMPNNPGLPKDFFPASLKFLERVCSKAGDEDWQAAVANAVSALLVFLKHFNGQPGIQEETILPSVCRLLPVGGDLQEARVVHQIIFEYVQKQNPNVVGPNGNNMTAVRAIAKKLLDEATADKDDSRITEETGRFIAQMF